MAYLRFLAFFWSEKITFQPVTKKVKLPLWKA